MRYNSLMWMPQLWSHPRHQEAATYSSGGGAKLIPFGRLVEGALDSGFVTPKRSEETGCGHIPGGRGIVPPTIRGGDRSLRLGSGRPRLAGPSIGQQRSIDRSHERQQAFECIERGPLAPFVHRAQRLRRHRNSGGISVSHLARLDKYKHSRHIGNG